MIDNNSFILKEGVTPEDANNNFNLVDKLMKGMEIPFVNICGYREENNLNTLVATKGRVDDLRALIVTVLVNEPVLTKVIRQALFIVDNDPGLKDQLKSKEEGLDSE